jgi:hypothetical protein
VKVERARDPTRKGVTDSGADVFLATHHSAINGHELQPFRMRFARDRSHIIECDCGPAGHPGRQPFSSWRLVGGWDSR